MLKSTKKAKDAKAPEKKNAWLGYSEAVKKEVFELNDGYKKFISDCIADNVYPGGLWK